MLSLPNQKNHVFEIQGISPFAQALAIKPKCVFQELFSGLGCFQIGIGSVRLLFSRQNADSGCAFVSMVEMHANLGT
jgi:hypothetical protein